MISDNMTVQGIKQKNGTYRLLIYLTKAMVEGEDIKKGNRLNVSVENPQPDKVWGAEKKRLEAAAKEPEETIETHEQTPVEKETSTERFMKEEGTKPIY